MNIEELLSLLQNVKKSGDSWVASCPAHPDKNPSLSVSERDGTILLKCHAGCKAEAIVAALGLTMKDLFSGNGNGTGSKGETRPIISTYDYHDPETGQFLFQEAHFATKPKSKPRHKDPDGRWRWGAGTNKRPLYGQRELQDKPEACVTEGPKDANELKKLGIPATCTPFGKWEPEHAEALRGKDLFLFWDNDDPGRVKRDKAVEFLKGVAKSIRIVNLPTDEKPEGYDVSDFIAEFEDREAAKEKLCILMSEAEEPQKSTSPSTIDNRLLSALIPGDQISTRFRETLKQRYLVRDFLSESSNLSCLYGSPGTYKSFMALDVGLSCSSGIEWHGRPTKESSVLYIGAEGQSGILKRITAWQVQHGIKKTERFFLLPVPVLIDINEQLQGLLSLVSTLKEPPCLIIVDTLARCMAGDENSTSDMGKIVLACGQITQETGAQVLIVHHTGKDETRGARGAIALTGATDTMFRVTKTGDRQCMLTCERQKDHEIGAPLLFKMQIVDTGFLDADVCPVTSLVPEIDTERMANRKRDKNQHHLSGANRIALESLEEAIRRNGQSPSDEILRVTGEEITAVVHEDVWRDLAYTKGISDGDSSAKRKSFQRARSRLMDLGIIQCFYDYYWKI